MMNNIFKTLIDEGVMVVYIDDILIFTESLEQHHDIVQNALEILCTNHLYLKLEKCLFTQLKVLILSQGQVATDPVKVSGVWNWSIPHNVTEGKSFLGFIDFYQRSIKDFSHIAKPLNQGTKVNIQ